MVAGDQSYRLPGSNAVSNTKYNVYWNENYTASEYAFDTTRKSGEVAGAIRAGSADVDLVDPDAFTGRATDLVRSVHEPEYVDAVTEGRPEDLARSQGFDWDRGIPTMAIAHSAGLVAAVTEVLSGQSRVAGTLSSGLHHARASRGAGFCTFNGLAVAAEAARGLGAERILVLDLDAHCGGGTRSLTDPEAVVQVDVSTVHYDRWIPSGADALLFVDHDDYLDQVDAALALADRVGTVDLVLYNAGMDPVTDSGVSTTDITDREHRVAEWAALNDHRLVYALAGGYTSSEVSMSRLVDLHLLTVRAFS
jgi:acetoin utilization deacetylase AcuC-like enzyme